METLTAEMIDAIASEFQSMPGDLLKFYRDPPGRKPSEHLLRLRNAIASIDDETMEALIRDVVDATVFQMVYLMGASFKSDLDLAISRGDEQESLRGTVLHENYRAHINPGGIPFKSA
jgi:hypothetical protein